MTGISVAARFPFGESVNVRSTPGYVNSGEFIMQQSDNTAFVLDVITSKLRLAHTEQLAPSAVVPQVPVADKPTSHK